jgi:hypothetical protein
MVQAGFSQGQIAINNRGTIAFAAQLDADVNFDGIQDTGVYIDRGGKISAVVRTGTVIPGLGTVRHVNNPFVVGSPYPHPSVSINASDEVLTQVILDTGETYTIVASQHH